MRGCMLLLTIAVAALAQEPPVAQNSSSANTISAGVPLRVALEGRVRIKRVGEPIKGRLVEPIYVFDHELLPAGIVVEGHVAEIGGIPVRRRLNALLSGNFTPPRDVRAQFDAIVLSDGSHLPLRTSLATGTAHTARIGANRKSRHAQPSAIQSSGGREQAMDPATIRAFTAPGAISRLKSTLVAMLPYHRQAWSIGTMFISVLQEPLTAPAPRPADVRTDIAADAESEAQEVHARLLTRITSETARRGEPVEAEVTRPLFSPGHELLIPQGSRLLGDVIQAHPARRFHRNGKVMFVFRQVKLPAGAVQNIQGYLESVEADRDAHLALDSEGTTRASSPKTRFIFPAVAAVVAGLSFHQDYNAQGVPDQDIGGRAESGTVGLGLIGTVLAQTSRALASSMALSGAGFSVYSTFIARGEDVVLRANTPVKVNLKARGCEAGGGKLAQVDCGDAALDRKK